ncbi:MAG TPA: ORF6N domain-containing protein [Pyrinomonadaceae bacterium]|nr:ORF6N domain-containing protein [Pyrinomonadaceae bacterium]
MTSVVTLDQVERRIYLIRGEKVMLDSELAAMYGVETRVLNQAVPRNSDRFPEVFMFQLTKDEFDNLKSHFVTSNGMRFQIGT